MPLQFPLRQRGRSSRIETRNFRYHRDADPALALPAAEAAAGPLAGLNETARVAVVQRFEKAGPDLFGWVRDATYIAYYESPSWPRQSFVGQCVQKVAEAEILAWGGSGTFLSATRSPGPGSFASLRRESGGAKPELTGLPTVTS
jgi:hypothetical protein